MGPGWVLLGTLASFLFPYFAASVEKCRIKSGSGFRWRPDS